MLNKFLTVPFEIKAATEENGKGVIEGYASTFGNIDLGLDIVDKGAFAKTLQENGGKIPILADHNPSKQIGWNLEATEDNIGLKVRGELDIENNQLAKERFSLAKKAKEIGASFGLSIGYMTIKEEPDSDNPAVRRLKEVKLLEYSFVTFPMNTQAMVTAAKHWNAGFDQDIMEGVAKLLEMGHTKDTILKALEKAAETNNKPSEDAHLVLESINKVKNILS